MNYGPGGVQHNLAFNYPFPIVITKAEGNKLYDIASSSLLTYSNTVGRLNVYSDGFEYDKLRLLPFEGLTEMSRDNFTDTYFNKTVSRYKATYPDNYADVLHFTADCNVLYFDGDYAEIHRLMSKSKKIFKAIKKNSNGNLSHFFRVSNIDQKILSDKW